jgi:hypothetical protein
MKFKKEDLDKVMLGLNGEPMVFAGDNVEITYRNAILASLARDDGQQDMDQKIRCWALIKKIMDDKADVIELSSEDISFIKRRAVFLPPIPFGRLVDFLEGV